MYPSIGGRVHAPSCLYPAAEWFVEAFGTNAVGAWIARHAAPGWWQPVALDIDLPDRCAGACACERTDCADCVDTSPCLSQLETEMALYHAARGEPADVLEVQWSAGVTSRSPAALTALRDATDRHFRLTANANRVAVVDPCDATEVSLATLRALGATTLRILSYGDGHAAAAVITATRRLGFPWIEACVSATPARRVREAARLIDCLIAAAPDRIVLPSAHRGDAARRLIDAGYSCVARNVFAPASGQSADARVPRPANRPPFASSARPVGSVIALGPRSVGRLGPLSYQNHRVPRDYFAALERETLPIERGLLLTHDDIVRGAVIASLSADLFVDIAMLEAAYGIDFRRYFSAEWKALRNLERAGALSIDATHLVLTPQGRLACDDVCRVFDRRTRMLTEACTRSHLL